MRTLLFFCVFLFIVSCGPVDMIDGKPIYNLFIEVLDKDGNNKFLPETANNWLNKQSHLRYKGTFSQFPITRTSYTHPILWYIPESEPGKLLLLIQTGNDDFVKEFVFEWPDKTVDTVNTEYQSHTIIINGKPVESLGDHKNFDLHIQLFKE